MIELEPVSPEKGLTQEEVRQRVQEGLVNRVPDSPTRTVGEIVRANVFTRFNFLLGGLLVVVLLVLREPRDALFGLVVVSNSAIGIIQEIRAKRTLDRLEVIASPKVLLVRDGEVKQWPIDQIVLDDLIELRPGDQLAVDGEVELANGLEIDESLLTGESDPVEKSPGDRCLSGSFVAAGSGRYRATKVGADSYAVQLAQAAKRFTLVRSELRDGINWVLKGVSWVVIPMMLLIAWSVERGGEIWLEALRGAVAAGVAMVPQGLVLLTSIAFAVGVIRLGQKNVLVQELPAIEGLARVDTVCFDKTGTITEGKLTVKKEVRLSEGDFRGALATIAAHETNPNATLMAVAAACDEPPQWKVETSVPFSSARKWSGVGIAGQGTWVMGAPDIVAADHPEVAEKVEEASHRGSRVLVVSTTDEPLVDRKLPGGLRPVALLILSDQVRADAAETISYFSEQGVDIKVISGDHHDTVAAVARLAGIDGEAIDARSLTDHKGQLAEAMERYTIFGRVDPHQKRDMVKALQARGHVVAMTGDGVNDVLALKEADIGVAVGEGAPASRAVAQLVLIDSKFSSLPGIVGEGRRVTSNVERVANLFLTSTVYAIGLSLAIIISALPFPFLPRHLTLVGSLTIGIPAFFLALAPSRQRARPGFVGRVLRFAVPTGAIATAASFSAYWLADMEGSTIEQSRTTATVVLAAIGMFALAIVARPLVLWKKALISSMIGLFLLAIASPAARAFFELEMPRFVVFLAAMGIAGMTGALMILALRALGWARLVPELLREVPPIERGGWRRFKERVADRSGWNLSFPTTAEMEVVKSAGDVSFPEEEAAVPEEDAPGGEEE
jgi:cation-transporting P-type ATPase E